MSSEKPATGPTSLLEDSSRVNGALQATTLCQAEAASLPSTRLKGGNGISTFVIKNRIGDLSLFYSNKLRTSPTNLSPPLSSKSTADEPHPIKRHFPPDPLKASPLMEEQGHLRALPHPLSLAPEDGPKVVGVNTPLACSLRLTGDTIPCESGKWSRGEGSLLQGSMFLLACDSHQEMALVYRALLKYQAGRKAGTAVLVSGFYYGRVVTHLDVAKLSNLTPIAFHLIPTSLENRLISLVNEELIHCQKELLRCLDAYQKLLSAN